MRWAAPALALATSAQLAPQETCLATGAGDWVASSLEPVKLSPSFLKNWGTSVFWWGQCHDEPKALRWEPRGDGCDGLAAAARSPTLARDFCDAFSGASMMLVGDSVQGELFSTLAALLGADRGVQDEAAARRRCLPGSRLMAHHAHEVRVEALVCGGRVGIRFIRNEFLLWAGARDTLDAAAIRRQDNKYLCDWADDASGADLLVPASVRRCLRGRRRGFVASARVSGAYLGLTSNALSRGPVTYTPAQARAQPRPPRGARRRVR